jgi:hypothetical protein
MDSTQTLFAVSVEVTHVASAPVSKGTVNTHYLTVLIVAADEQDMAQAVKREVAKALYTSQEWVRILSFTEMRGASGIVVGSVPNTQYQVSIQIDNNTSNKRQSIIGAERC